MLAAGNEIREWLEIITRDANLIWRDDLPANHRKREQYFCAAQQKGR